MSNLQPGATQSEIDRALEAGEEPDNTLWCGICREWVNAEHFEDDPSSIHGIPNPTTSGAAVAGNAATSQEVPLTQPYQDRRLVSKEDRNLMLLDVGTYDDVLALCEHADAMEELLRDSIPKRDVARIVRVFMKLERIASRDWSEGHPTRQNVDKLIGQLLYRVTGHTTTEEL
jgi:hypothetical protein